ncbi:MAG: hypothetical protein IPL65_09550 [Lewinellaceae bacterium]|nr:hypothetical protein [Lewinellaceae bacterium]
MDSLYATGGNVEHQPNGLLMNIDNWIYSAKSDVRCRRINGKWLKEKTAFRGQWGITHDDFGRLFYNDNSNRPGRLDAAQRHVSEPVFEPSHGVSEQICTNQRVYPLRPTAVNRGYQDGMLDSSGHLLNFTSACGPLLYRGDQISKQFQGNAFVAQKATSSSATAS